VSYRRRRTHFVLVTNSRRIFCAFPRLSGCRPPHARRVHSAAQSCFFFFLNLEDDRILRVRKNLTGNRSCGIKHGFRALPPRYWLKSNIYPVLVVWHCRRRNKCARAHYFGCSVIVVFEMISHTTYTQYIQTHAAVHVCTHSSPHTQAAKSFMAVEYCVILLNIV